MDNVRLDLLRERGFTFDTVFSNGRYEDLKTKLLNEGGSAVILVVNLDKKYDELLNKGEWFYLLSGVVKMRPSQCHDNVDELVKTNSRYKEYSGFALSEDGAWRFHSWVVDGDKGVIETTSPRLAYYGIENFWD